MSEPTRSKPILCIDFDGVIHAYTSPWTNATTISDGPVPGALRWLWKATEWFNVYVYSSRSSIPEARQAMRYWMAAHSADEFGHDHPMAAPNDRDDFTYPIIFASEKPAAFLTIDDRALTFDGDWSEWDPADLLMFKPWNKRPPAPKAGATGAFPEGKLHAGDEGELRMAVGRAPDGNVHINFGKDVSWLALPPNAAKEFAALLMRHAAAGAVNN